MPGQEFPYVFQSVSQHLDEKKDTWSMLICESLWLSDRTDSQNKPCLNPGKEDWSEQEACMCVFAHVKAIKMAVEQTQRDSSKFTALIWLVRSREKSTYLSSNVSEAVEIYVLSNKTKRFSSKCWLCCRYQMVTHRIIGWETGFI